MRIAVIGTSKITERFITAARQLPEIEISAVYSRNIDTGNEFAKKHQIEEVYTNLELFASSDEFDAVYIASPNYCHHTQAIKILNHGKHVLCEKPIASNSQEVQAMFEAAAENDVVLLEAMRSIFDPGFAKIKELLPQLGIIRRVQFAMNQYSSRYDHFKQGIIENAFQPALSNAALMDIGVYCVHPLVRLFGRPKKVIAESIFLENGMEGIGTALLRYPDMLAEVQYSKITQGSLPSQIQGEDALMLIDQIQDTRKIQLIYRDGKIKEHIIEKHKNTMIYEIQTFVHLIKEHCVHHSYKYSSLLEMGVMDQIRRFAGIEFENQEEA